MGTKMQNAPLYFTIGQIQFNPILNLDAYLPAIQAKMREMHFPDFRQEVIQELVFPASGNPAGQAAPTLTHKSRYKFGDLEGWQSFFLDQNTLLFQTTRYDTFESFLGNIMRVVAILHDEIHLDFIERLGLRYLDAVHGAFPDESLAQYLVPEVMGLANKLGGKLSYAISETISIVPAGQLMVRVVMQNGKIGLPAELIGLTDKFSDQIMAYDGEHAIIDNDASNNQRMVFDIGNVQQRLIALHDALKAAFETIITAHAKARWA